MLSLLTSTERTSQCLQELGTYGCKGVLLKQFRVERNGAEQSTNEVATSRMLDFLTYNFIIFIQIRQFDTISDVKLASN